MVGHEAYESELELLCREPEIGVMTYSSLTSEFLTVKYQPNQELPQSARIELTESLIDKQGFRILTEVECIAFPYNVIPAWIARAQLMARPRVTALIVSCASVEQTRELLVSMELKLDSEVIKTLNTASA